MLLPLLQMKTQIFVLLLFLSFSCKPQNNSLLEIDPRSFTDNKITLGAIADDISYIPLDDSIPIGINYKLKITGSNIYLSVKDVGILKFDRSGKIHTDLNLGFAKIKVYDNIVHVFNCKPFIAVCRINMK